MTLTDKEKLEEIKACLDVYDKSLPISLNYFTKAEI